MRVVVTNPGLKPGVREAFVFLNPEIPRLQPGKIPNPLRWASARNLPIVFPLGDILKNPGLNI